MFDRKKQLRWASLKVGIVITLTLLIVFIVIIFSGGIKSLFQQQEIIKVAVSDVKGLRPGAPVRVAGVDVGAVNEIKLDKNFGTIVTIAINKDILNFLKKDAKASVQTIGLLGDKYLEISTGTAQESFNKSQVMEGYPQTEIRDIIGIASSALIRIDKLIKDVDTLISEMRDAKGTVYKLLKDPTLYNNLNSITAELKITIEEIRTGTLGMISKDKELYKNFTNTIKNFEEISNKVNNSSGSLGKFINEPELYENLLNSSKKLDRLLNEIENSEGTISLLLKDKQTATDLKQSIRELKELIEEIKKDPKKFFKFSVF